MNKQTCSIDLCFLLYINPCLFYFIFNNKMASFSAGDPPSIPPLPLRGQQVGSVHSNSVSYASNYARLVQATRNLINIPSIKSAIEPTWSILEPALQNILNVFTLIQDVSSSLDNLCHIPPSEVMAPEYFMNLYTAVFEWCIAEPAEFSNVRIMTKEENINNSTPSTSSTLTISVDREYVLYACLFLFLDTTYSELTKKLLSISEESISSHETSLQIRDLTFARIFSLCANRVIDGCKQISSIFAYLERHWWEKAQSDKIDPDHAPFLLYPIKKIQDLCKACIEKSLLQPCQTRIKTVLIQLLDVERVQFAASAAVTAPIPGITDIITSLVQIYRQLSTPTVQIRSRTRVFNLTAMEAHYRTLLSDWCSKWIEAHPQSSSNSSSEEEKCLTLVAQLHTIWERETWMANEHIGNDMFIRSLLKLVLLDPYMDYLLNCFSTGVINGISVMVKNIYVLLSSRKTLVDKLESTFEQALILRCRDRLRNSDSLLDFLMAELDYSAFLIKQCSVTSQDQTTENPHVMFVTELVDARDRAFKAIVNRGEVRYHLPLALVSLLDKQLRVRIMLHKTHVDSPNEEIFNSTMQLLFRWTEEKETFMIAYGERLVMRLTQCYFLPYLPQDNPQNLLGEEELILCQLKDMAGPGYTSHLYRILSDYVTTRWWGKRDTENDMTSIPTHSSAYQTPIDCAVFPLSSLHNCAPQGGPLATLIKQHKHTHNNSHQLALSQQQSINLPSNLLHGLDHFTATYGQIFKHRIIHWIPELSTVTIAIEFFDHQKHTFTVMNDKLTIFTFLILFLFR